MKSSGFETTTEFDLLLDSYRLSDLLKFGVKLKVEFFYMNFNFIRLRLFNFAYTMYIFSYVQNRITMNQQQQ